MRKLREAVEILSALGLPRKQQNDRSALTLLALANLGPRSSWRTAEQPPLRIWDIMAFMRARYKKDYAANTRETIRRQTIHQFEQARIVDRNPDDPARPTNSGKNCYALTDDALSVIRTFGTPRFDGSVARFMERFGSLQAAYERNRDSHCVTLTMPDGSGVHLSPGKHNELQVAVVQEFGPRFAPGAVVLYVGDTARKHVICEAEILASVRIPITRHDKLPDIVLYWKERNWLYLIEAVTSHGPVNPKRHRELERVLVKCPADRIYVTAFLDIATFRTYAADIAWETEVWIASQPDHMIHFNGTSFLGPYQTQRR